MFKWNLHKQFSFFLLDEYNGKVPFSKWSEYQEQHLSQLSILFELIDNGFATCKKYSCDCEIEDILNLTEIEQQILNLPPLYPYEIYIQSNGQLNQKIFKFNYGFYDFFPNGNKLFAERKAAIIKIREREYLLSNNQYLICEALDNFNLLPEEQKTFQSNLKCFSDIKSLSSKAASILDSYLQNENVFNPDKIKIDISFSNDTLEIWPNLETESQQGFLKVFDQFPSIKDVYPISDSNGRTRVIIDENKKNELKKIKNQRRVTDKNTINEIVEHPEHFFDDEFIDYSVFYSERVKEIGIYKPKFYPFICPYKSEWIPGISIKDKVDGEKRIFFKTVNQLNEFETEKIKAQNNGDDFLKWDGTEISINDADKFIDIAKKQFETPQNPIKEAKDNFHEEVLIIKENADFLEYVEEKSQMSEISHNFHAIDNFNPNIELKEHQIEGIAWFQSLFQKNIGGCLLADDMGLGKTLQLLYFIEWHSLHFDDSKPYLIVAPVAILENWENEYEKFFNPNNLTLRNLYGKIELTKEFNDKVNQKEAKELQHKHIILTNYETLRIYQATLCLVDYAVVVLDEAQKIKTPGTLITNVSKALKSDFKIAMTGTPVENSLVDIWCIMDFSTPGLLGNAKDFAKEFQNPLKNEETNIKELGEKLRQKIGVFIKRRLKQDVAKDLPLKFEYKNSSYSRVMPLEQLDRYKVEMELVKQSELSGTERRNQILKSLWAIRDISDHPYLADSQISKFNTNQLISTSAKLQILNDILKKIEAMNEKAIVFADRKETQKMLQKIIYDTFKIFPSIINGDTPSIKQTTGKSKLSRQQTIDRFQSGKGFNVIVMSQLAAGVGLNITEANHVIHYTRHWNPAKEQQATDRVYRIGQNKDVHVYYPMAVFPDDMKNENGDKLKTFDEILDQLLSRKMLLSTNTLFPTEQIEVRYDEIFQNVFSFETDNLKKPLSLVSIDKLTPNLFEACIAAIYKAKGHDVYLTPITNDKGADIVAISKNQSFLIQAKQSKTNIGVSAIQEIYGAKNYYEHLFNETFSLVVFTNSQFSSGAIDLSGVNNVDLIDRTKMKNQLINISISIQDIHTIESQRMKKV